MFYRNLPEDDKFYSFTEIVNDKKINIILSVFNKGYVQLDSILGYNVLRFQGSLVSILGVRFLNT